MNNLKLSEIPSKEEWIVEQINQENKTYCLGKIFVPPTIHLNTQQLEWIWDLCNYGPADYNLEKIDEDCIYNGFQAIFGKNMTYIPMKGINHCNDDIFIRKHYNMDIGYWIWNNHRKEKDTWVYTSRNNFIQYMKEHSFKAIPEYKFKPGDIVRLKDLQEPENKGNWFHIDYPTIVKGRKAYRMKEVNPFNMEGECHLYLENDLELAT